VTQCLLRTDNDDRTPLLLLCIQIDELTPEALDVVFWPVLEACPEAAGVRAWVDEIDDRLRL
jgi:hypothetical protein